MGERLETGIIQDGDDWPGVFIRGDRALGYLPALRMLIAGQAGPFERVTCEGLARLLAQCHAGDNPDVQMVQRVPASPPPSTGEDA